VHAREQLGGTTHLLSPLSGQGVNEAYDSRDMDGTEFKDERPNGENKLAAETNTKIDGTSNSIPPQ